MAGCDRMKEIVFQPVICCWKESLIIGTKKREECKPRRAILYQIVDHKDCKEQSVRENRQSRLSVTPKNVKQAITCSQPVCSPVVDIALRSSPR